MSPTSAPSLRLSDLQSVAPPFVGEVVYLYAFDVAYEMKAGLPETLLGEPVRPYQVSPDKHLPRSTSFFHALMADLPVVERSVQGGQVRLRRTVKVFPVGAISIVVRMRFAVDTLASLVACHDPVWSDGTMLHEEIRALAEEIREELEPWLTLPVPQLPEEEAYTVFCLHDPPGLAPRPEGDTEAWLRANRRAVAALLTQETAPEELSEQEVEETVSRTLCYYRRDLIVVDWDAALVVDEPDRLEATLYTMELANLQLEELEVYDRLLDEALERAYRHLAHPKWVGRRRALRTLRELRIDLTRFHDAIANITKFFGDWHLARLYQALAGRFHLADWRRIIDEKLDTADDLYQIVHSDQTNRWMLILETTIVLLFMIDLILLLAG